MYHVQKCNENSLVFFSLTLNNRNRWDCLRMLEFVCCLPKLGMILCYFSSLCLNKPAQLWKTKCNGLPSPPSPMYLYLSCFKLPIRNPLLKVPTCILPAISEAYPSFRRLYARLNPKYVRNVCSMGTQSSGHSNKEQFSQALVFLEVKNEMLYC